MISRFERKKEKEKNFVPYPSLEYDGIFVYRVKEKKGSNAEPDDGNETINVEFVNDRRLVRIGKKRDLKETYLRRVRVLLTSLPVKQ